MGNLLIRRREMILSSASPSPIVPSGYVTDGLVFFLDGLQLASASSWTDIVGGKTFSLTGCSMKPNGVYFDGSAYGEMPGTITSDWENETIELAFTPDDVPKSSTFLNQPLISGASGISMHIGGIWSGNLIGCTPVLDGVRRGVVGRFDAVKTSFVAISSNIWVQNGIEKTSYSDSYGANTLGITTLGCRGNASRGTKIRGIVHAIRIYSKHLSLAEILANEQADSARYGIT